jgi:DNA polymerase elongation subunit (family B)
LAWNSSRNKSLSLGLGLIPLRSVACNLSTKGTNSQQARLVGLDFYSVYSRGSQVKVESLMFRIAKPESFLLVSPTRAQVCSGFEL